MCNFRVMSCDREYNNHCLILTNNFQIHIYINLCKCPLTEPISLLNYMKQVIRLSFLKWSFKALFNGSSTLRSFINVSYPLTHGVTEGRVEWSPCSFQSALLSLLALNRSEKLRTITMAFLFFFYNKNESTIKKTLNISY